MLEKEGWVKVQKRREKIEKVIIHIPIDVARDSQFPFKESSDAIFLINPKERKIIIKPK